MTTIQTTVTGDAELGDVPPPHPKSTGAETLAAMVLRAAERHGDATALRSKRGGEWHDVSYRELGESARAIARGLIGLGIEPGDRVAILASTRPEWTLVDCGAMCAGAVVVPIYQTNSPEECRYVLEHSGAKAVICEDVEQLDKISRIQDDCPALEHVVAFDGAHGRAPSLDGLRAGGLPVDEDAPDRIAAATRPTDIATVVYTSGTTGPPKGCVLTHANWMATLRMYESRLDVEDELTIFLFLPLAHVLARITQMVALDAGGTLAFWQGDTKQVLEDIATTRPTYLPTVPRVLEKIHAKALGSVEEGGRAKRAIFGWALATGGKVRGRERAGHAVGPLLRAQHALADRLVLSKVRDLFGGNLHQALTGAAPIGREVLDFFDACGVLVLEGYGMTESTAAATLNIPDGFRFGTVGRPLPGTEVAIADDGEILIRGPHVFDGYWRNTEATSDTIVDGWLATGDLGRVDADGFLSISGRKKDLIITSSGKNITPVNIETALRETRWISQAVVYGDRRSYLVAIVSLDDDGARELAEHLGIEYDRDAMTRDPRVLAEIQSAVDEVNARFARIEQVKKFALLDHDLSQEEGELTPTMKVKRAKVYERYADVFDRLYAE
jgi:long-chain acyl-CoA synthetase